MTLEWLREQISGLKKKLTEFGEELAELTNLDEMLVSGIDNLDEAIRKINNWMNTAHDDTKAAMDRDAPANSRFGAYYLNHIDGILGDGTLDEAKDSLSSNRSKANKKLIETDDAIEAIEEAINSVKEKIAEFKNKLKELFGLEE